MTPEVKWVRRSGLVRSVDAMHAIVISDYSLMAVCIIVLILDVLIIIFSIFNFVTEWLFLFVQII